MQWVINASKIVIFPVAYIRFKCSDGPQKTLTLESPATSRTPPVVLEQTLGSSTQGRRIKILTSKQMLQRLSILLAQVKFENTSQNLVNEISQIAYSLYCTKEFQKKNTIIYLCNIQMSATLMSSENGKTSDAHMDLRRGRKRAALSDLDIYYTWKNIRRLYGNNKLKMSGTTRDEEFELPDGSYSVSDFEDYFEYTIKTNNEAQADKPPVQIYVNKNQN